MREENLEYKANVRQEYLDTMRRFEAGEDDVSVLDVLGVAFRYLFSNPREYSRTFFKKRFKKDRTDIN